MTENEFPPLQCSSGWLPWIMRENAKLLNNNTTTKKSTTAKKKTATAWLKSSTSSSSSSSSTTTPTMDLLQLLAINALEFTAPASAAFSQLLSPTSTTTTTNNSPATPSTNCSDVKSLAQDETQHTKNPPIQHIRRSFVQLSGHPGCFAPAGPNTLWKKQGDGSYETNVYEYLSNSDDSMKSLIPHFCSKTEWNGETFLEIEDLLTRFDQTAAVMDLKIGLRTFLESEVTNSSARHDLYQKMVKVNPTAPTEKEHEAKALTKLRYMQFREEQSSTSSLGFRIEAVKFRNSKEAMSDLQLTKTDKDVSTMMGKFLQDSILRSQLLERLQEMRRNLESSDFFMTHEVIGSSILLIHDSVSVGAWLIDFAKTIRSPIGRLKHTVPWQMGNHEDGYLVGLDNLIKIIEAS